MKYTLGFKSGNTVEVDVRDGAKFANDIQAGVNNDPSALVQWYCEPGLILVVSELEFVVPSHMARLHDSERPNAKLTSPPTTAGAKEK